MATNVVKAPIFRAVASRSYSQALPISGQVSNVKTCVLPNKVTVASADNGSPLARLSIVYRAGSRYEQADNQGAAHVIRIAAGLSTKSNTHFAIIRNIQQFGATLTCTTDRETIAYTLEGTYDSVDRSSDYLSDIASEQIFKPWELSDCVPRLKLELANLSPQVRVINFLHRAAFRQGLGNSLFCAKHNVGKLSTETLQHYVAKNFTTSRAAVVGLGVNHEQLIKYAQHVSWKDGSSEDTPSKYHGGEIRSEKGGDLAFVAIGAEGGSLCNATDAVAFAVLQRVFGVGPYTKRGVDNCGILSKAVGNTSVAVSALNASYSDSGLFGALIAGPSKHICESVVKAADALRSGKISDADIKRAKYQLMTAALLSAESGSNFVETMGTQAVITGKVSTPEDICREIEGISVDHVKKAASKVANSKLSIASVGNISNVPYLDEL